MSAAASPAPKPRRRWRWIDIKEQLAGYLFVFPAFLIIAIFGLFPIGYSVYVSTYNWRVRQGKFIGLGNFEKALGDWQGMVFFIGGILLLVAAYIVWQHAFKAATNRGLVTGVICALLLIGAGWLLMMGWGRMQETGDPRFLDALPRTVFYALGTVPAEIGIALVLAYILFQNIKGQEFFRMIYFLPYITPVVATAVVFRTIFSPRESSLANQALALIGQDPQKWLFEPAPFVNAMFGMNLDGLVAGPSMALVSIIFFGVWTYIGYNTVIFLAGLGSIPGDLYEAAKIDGANNWHLFRYITLPLLSPVTFYLALIAFIGTFKAFNHIYVMRQPSALGTADVASVEIFDTFYKANQYGYASSQALILFAIILALTLVQNKVFGEKVFYG
ncbi:MAG: sugar ABC transporter permease [Chloroflexota bacterium]|nr:sugar ABC transporter permease [Chloroflexota bacterium]